MNEDNLSELFSFETNIDDTGNINIPEDKFVSYKQKGFSEIKIRVYADSKNLAENLGYDSKLFEEIKNMQSLPDSVVLDLLTCKGKITGNNFENRISF